MKFQAAGAPLGEARLRLCAVVKPESDDAARSQCVPRGLLPVPHAGEVKERAKALERKAVQREAGGEGRSTVSRRPSDTSLRLSLLLRGLNSRRSLSCSCAACRR